MSSWFSDFGDWWEKKLFGDRPTVTDLTKHSVTDSFGNTRSMFATPDVSKEELEDLHPPTPDEAPDEFIDPITKWRRKIEDKGRELVQSAVRPLDEAVTTIGETINGPEGVPINPETGQPDLMMVRNWKTALSAAVDPVGTAYGPEAFRHVTDELLGPGPEDQPVGPPWLQAMEAGSRELVEKGLGIASSPVTAMFGVPGVASSLPGRAAIAGFGLGAAKGGGEQLGEVMALTQDQDVPWTDPEVARRLAGGVFDLGLAPVMLGHSVRGVETSPFVPDALKQPVEPYLAEAGRAVRDFAMPETDLPGGREAGVFRWKGPEEEIAALERIVNSDRPASERMMAQIRLEEIRNPEIPDASVVDAELLRDAGIVPEANVIPPEGGVKRVAPQEDFVSGKKGTPDIEDTKINNVNDVLKMTMEDPSKAPRATDMRLAREVYEQAAKNTDRAIRASDITKILEERKNAPPKVEEAPNQAEVDAEHERMLAEILREQEAQNPLPPPPPETPVTKPAESVEPKGPPGKYGHYPDGTPRDLAPIQDHVEASLQPKPKTFEEHLTSQGYERRVSARGRESWVDSKGNKVTKPDLETLRKDYSPTPETSQPPTTPPAEPLASERPPVPDGHVRVYRGGEGNFFTTEESRAGSYTKEGQGSYVDVPKEVFEAGRSEAAKHGQPTPQDTYLPDEWVKKAQGTKLKQEIHEIKPEDMGDDIYAELGIKKVGPLEEGPSERTPLKTHPKVQAIEEEIGNVDRRIAAADRRLKQIPFEGPEKRAGERRGTLDEVRSAEPEDYGVDPRDFEAAREPREVNPVDEFISPKTEPGPVEPVKKTTKARVEDDVDTAERRIKEDSGVDINEEHPLDSPEGKKLVKSTAKALGITEDAASRMLKASGSTESANRSGGPRSISTGKGGRKGRTPGAGGQGTNLPPGKTISGGSRPAPLPARELDIIEWMRERKTGNVSTELVKRKFENLPKGTQTMIDYESGKLDLPRVRQFFERWHKRLVKAGVDLGWHENYVTHLWKEEPKVVREKLGKTLGLKPGFAMERGIPTLEEGIQAGLTPRFENINEVMGWYERAARKAMADRGFFNWLKSQKQIKTADKAPRHWVTLNPDRFPIRKWKGNQVVWKASPEMAEKINNYLYEPDADPSTFVKGLNKVAHFSSALKNIRLAAGIPFTKLNYHAFSIMAHHVLSTPRWKGIPNLPKMLGRGFRDLRDMADPRMTKWTDLDLKRAKVLQRHSEITLSTEDHTFDPALRGAIKQRLKDAEGFGKFRVIIDRMFEEPLFNSFLPKLKLNHAWELAAEFRKQGMSRQESFAQAGKIVNRVYGGLNLDENFRNKTAQNVARIVALAPDWLESNARLTGNLAKSPFSKGGEGRFYRDFLTNLVAVYVMGNIFQKAMTGRAMWENSPGNQFSVYLGKNPSNGKERYLKPFGAGIQGVRIIYDTAEAIARREDLSSVARPGISRLSIPAGFVFHTAANKGPFGQSIMKSGDTLGGQLSDVGEFAFEQAVPQYVAGPVAAIRGEISPELGLAQAVEFPYTEVTPRKPSGKRTKKKKRKKSSSFGGF